MRHGMRSISFTALALAALLGPAPSGEHAHAPPSAPTVAPATATRPGEAAATHAGGAAATHAGSVSTTHAGRASAKRTGGEVSALRAELERLIASPHWPRDRWSVLVVSLDGGDTLFDHASSRALAPASNLKLFTSAAALYYLGPGFRYETYVAAAGPVRDGVLQGDLVLYGTGDPTISDRLYPSKTAVWEELADTLAAKGIREIRGRVIGDASYFSGRPFGRGWKIDYVNAWYAAPASALTYAEAMVTLRIEPGARTGWRPAVLLVPGGDGIALVNQATTVARGATHVEVTRAAYDGPIVMTGQIRKGSSAVWRAVPVADPARYAALTFGEVLRARGITVDGEASEVHAPEASPITGRGVFAPALTGRPPLQVLAVHHSPPLIDILTVLNKRSHNLYAEQILRTVGRVTAGEGSVEAGRNAVESLLREQAGVDDPTLRMVDGSGLSTLDRTDAATIVRLLAFMSGTPYFDAFVSTLPEAGGLGLHRMHRTPAEGNLHAKTGTIDSVSALSGYVRAADGERLAFSIISNDVPSTWRAKRVEDAIGSRLARFDRPLPAPALAARGGPPSAASPPVAGAPAGGQRAAGASAAGTGADGAAAPSAGPRTYTVRRGDTFESIARRYGLEVAALKEANPDVNPRRLQIGQEVTVPGGP